MKDHQRRIEDHTLLFELYRYAEQYQEMLYFVGHEEKAKAIQELRQRIAKEHVLDRLLRP